MKRWLQDPDNRLMAYSAIISATMIFVHFAWGLPE